MTLPKITWQLLFSGLLLLEACQQKQSSSQAVDANADTSAIMRPDAFTTAPDLAPPHTVLDTQFITVDSMGNIKLNNKAIPSRPDAFDSSLATYWRQFYNSEKKLPVYFRFIFQGDVLMGTRDDLTLRLVQVQRSLKDHIADDKYHKAFNRLDAGKQKEMKRDFPVLFQEVQFPEQP